jgi:predicted O-linked N-acetylglucosamine transferase (SPINDLY family)
MLDLAELLQFAAAQQRAKNWDEAERAYRQALALAPREPGIRRQLAWLLFDRGRHGPAIEEMRRAVADAPWPALHNDLGVMLRESGRDDDAARCFEEAVRTDPALWQAQFNLGNIHRQRGQLELALENYAAARRHAPDDPDVLVNLGVVQKGLGRLDDAQSTFEQAARMQPPNADAWIRLGTVHRARGQMETAIDCYRRALAINPQSAVAHNNLGLALRGLNRLEEAIESFSAAIRCDPGYAAAQANLGNAYESQGDTSLARACFAEASRGAGADAMKIKRALTLPVILESAAHIEETRRRLNDELDALAGERLRVDDPAASIGAPAFALAYHGRDERATQAKIARILHDAAPSLAFVAPHCAAPPRPRAGRRIKVGFVSAHLHAHTIGKLNAGLIERLNREEFEVFVLWFPRDDEIARRIAATADACVALPPQMADVQRRVAQCELDVLFYTDIGIDYWTYYLAHARLAPVQCLTWGHPLTTGIPTLDYFISAEHLEPVGAERHYSEKLVRLPHLANYYFRPQPSISLKTRRDFGLPEDARVYACLQSLFKLHPDDDAVFGEILRRDPAARLALLEGNFPRWTELLKARFRRSIPDVCDRIDFLPHQPPGDFSRLLATVDALLDPLHFGGGDTSYQSFAVGAPIVTLPSGFLRGRITYALYRAMAIDDLIATDADDCVQLAVRLANDRPWRDQMRDKILAGGDKIFENPAGVRELESFLINSVRAR